MTDLWEECCTRNLQGRPIHAEWVEVKNHEQLKALANVHFIPEGIEGFAEQFEELYGPVSTAQCFDKRIGMNRYDTVDGTFVHLINYDYSEQEDRVKPVEELKVTLRSLPGRQIRVYRLDGETDAFSTEFDGDVCTITLTEVPVYTVIEVLRSDT